MSRLEENEILIQFLHELHKLVFGLIHELCGNCCLATFFRKTLDFFSGHGLNEVWDIFEPLFGVRRPGHPVRGILRIVHNLERNGGEAVFSGIGFDTAFDHGLHEGWKLADSLLRIRGPLEVGFLRASGSCRASGGQSHLRDHG